MQKVIELLKCDNIFLAQKIAERLNEEGIPNIVIDESSIGTAMGAGPMPGWRIRINEEDYRRASEIVSAITHEKA